jgi:hypothetical protein
MCCFSKHCTGAFPSARRAYYWGSTCLVMSKTSILFPSARRARRPPHHRLDAHRSAPWTARAPPRRGPMCHRLEGCAALPHCRCSLRALFPCPPDAGRRHCWVLRDCVTGLAPQARRMLRPVPNLPASSASLHSIS